MFVHNANALSVAQVMNGDNPPQISYNDDLPEGPRTVLNLSGRKITNVGDLNSIPGIANVTWLDLSYNDINILPADVFCSMPQLRQLLVYRNEIRNISAGAFNRLNQLQFLRLDFNNIQSLPNSIFDNMPELKTLFLESNKIETLPAGIFDNLPQLETLHLNDNKIQTLPNISINLAQLNSIWLQHNRIPTIDDNTSNNLPNVDFFWIDNNQHIQTETVRIQQERERPHNITPDTINSTQAPYNLSSTTIVQAILFTGTLMTIAYCMHKKYKRCKLKKPAFKSVLA